jgi:hypothetical protein
MSGFTGANCEVDVDECDNFPCEHGYCDNLLGDYECHCLPGFEVGQSIPALSRGRKVAVLAFIYVYPSYSGEKLRDKP